tara:strand:- start:1877 stop:2866 length:990 start_codon:yes stop_codon:yes gene_type:complete
MMTQKPLDEHKVFVAGATGMVGSAVVHALLDSSPTVAVKGTYRSNTGAFVDDDRVSYVQVDLRTREGCREAVSGCSLAVLSAANTGGAMQTKTAPWQLVTDNVVMESLLLDAVHAEGIRKVVCLGTATVYQDFDGFIREDQLDLNVDPHAAYLGVGWAKRYIEKQCAFWHQATDIDISVIRAANVYGPNAQFNPERSNFIAALVRKAVDRMDPFEVWGSLDVTRDVIYSSDVADAAVRMLSQCSGFNVFNIGSERTTSVGEICDIALKCADHTPREVRQLGDRPVTIKSRGLDCRKARSELEWMPCVDINEGILRTMRWWESHKEDWKR